MTGSWVLWFLIPAVLCLIQWRRGKGQDKAVSKLVPEKTNSALLQCTPAPIPHSSIYAGSILRGWLFLIANSLYAAWAALGAVVWQQVALVINIDAGRGKAPATLTMQDQGSRDPALQAWQTLLYVSSGCASGAATEPGHGAGACLIMCLCATSCALE